MLRRVLVGVAVLLVAALVLLAQTTVRMGMLSGPASLGGVMVLAPNGTITFATVGAGGWLRRRPRRFR